MEPTQSNQEYSVLAPATSASGQRKFSTSAKTSLVIIVFCIVYLGVTGYPSLVAENKNRNGTQDTCPMRAVPVPEEVGNTVVATVDQNMLHRNTPLISDYGENSRAGHEQTLCGSAFNTDSINLFIKNSRGVVLQTTSLAVEGNRWFYNYWVSSSDGGQYGSFVDPDGGPNEIEIYSKTGELLKKEILFSGVDEKKTASIDPEALFSTSSHPTISGTAQGVDYVFLVLKTQSLVSKSIPVIDGKWSATLDKYLFITSGKDITFGPDTTDGLDQIAQKYELYIYAPDNAFLAMGNLMVGDETTPPKCKISVSDSNAQAGDDIEVTWVSFNSVQTFLQLGLSSSSPLLPVSSSRGSYKTEANLSGYTLYVESPLGKSSCSIHTATADISLDKSSAIIPSNQPFNVKISGSTTRNEPFTVVLLPDYYTGSIEWDVVSKRSPNSSIDYAYTATATTENNRWVADFSCKPIDSTGKPPCYSPSSSFGYQGYSIVFYDSNYQIISNIDYALSSGG